LPYLDSWSIAVIAISASLWAVLNWLISPIFWQLTQLPILCDMIGTSLLILTLWWTRKPGTASLMGIIATILNFVLRPDAIHFLGFTVASIVFDLVAFLIGYKNSLDRGRISSVILICISLISTTVAGLIIGIFFMATVFLLNVYGGVAVFAAIHGAGGIIGGVLGVVIVRGLERRRIITR